MAFITSAPTSTFTPRRALAVCPRRQRVAPRRVTRMGLGEDGLQEDMDFAKQCIDEGCSVDAVQDVLTRLERRRAVLSLELKQIEEVMSVLARENLGGDRGLVAQAMEAALTIFSKTNDDYPGVGNATNAWTMDPLKEQPKY